MGQQLRKVSKRKARKRRLKRKKSASAGAK